MVAGGLAANPYRVITSVRRFDDHGDHPLNTQIAFNKQA